MTIKSISRALLCLVVAGLLAPPLESQTTTTENTTNKNTTNNNTTTNNTFNNTNPYTTTTNTNRRTNTPGVFVPGKTYAVTSSQKTIQFAGKDVVLPQGVQFQFQDGFLIITLPQPADRNVAVVRLGKTYLVVTKKENLVIDPTGIPQTRNRIFRRFRPLRRPKIIRAIDDAPDASPVRP